MRRLFDAAVRAADPNLVLPPHLPSRPAGRTIVVGAGKASAAMARALEQHWPGPLSGLVVTRYGHAVPCERIEIVEASHPVPDAAGESAARRILACVTGLRADDLVIALMSGGGSALLTLPANGLTLDDKRAVNRALLASGADIAEMNCVRKHLSAIKGGRLAAAAFPAALTTLAISDVPGDSLSVIGSGPTVPDPTTFDDAREILRRYRVELPERVRRHLAGTGEETPKPGDRVFDRTRATLIATPQAALEAASHVARAQGVTPVILGDALEGEAREMGRVMAGIARQVRRHGQPAAAPCVLLSGGETTVTLRGGGRGGRNVEFLLALAMELRGETGIWALAADTDGIDGSEEVAGAVIGPDTPERARAAGLNLRQALETNDAHTVFATLGDQVVTGPTLTNVNDFRAILIDAA